MSILDDLFNNNSGGNRQRRREFLKRREAQKKAAEEQKRINTFYEELEPRKKKGSGILSKFTEGRANSSATANKAATDSTSILSFKNTKSILG